MSASTVVVTGIGATSPVGGTLDSTWTALRAGKSGIRALEDEWAQDLPTRIAGAAAVDPTEVLDRVEARKLDRSAQLAMVAGLEAWAHAGYELGSDDQVDPDRLGVCAATGIGGLQTLVENWDVLQNRGIRRVSPWSIPMLMPNAPAANLGLKIGARAGVHTPVSACASSNEAIAHALDMIRLGRADVVLAGGAEGVIHRLPIAAFGQMQALSRRNDDPEGASRPWDVDRDGFVLSEGAAALVLESLEHAQARGATIYGTIRGAGITADSHDLVQPDPDGRWQALAMTKAMKDAGLTPSDINHVNAHGTSTPQGDVTEAQSIRVALGDATDDVIVSSSKSMTGHLLGGAGALETVISLLCLKERVVTPTINLENEEPGLNIDIAKTLRDLPAGDLAAINNSFGFGGHNVTIIVTNEHVTA